MLREAQLDDLDAFLEQVVRVELGMTDDSADVNWPDFEGFWYPFEYVKSTWMDRRRHGTFPRVGGFNAQDPKWEADMRAVNARYNAWFDTLLRERNETGGKKPFVDRWLEDIGDAPPIESLFRD